MFPEKLNPGDHIRVISPTSSMSMGWISDELKEIALTRFAELGLNVSFASHVDEIDEFNTTSIQARVDDLHQAFSDPTIKMIITSYGGFSCNQLLGYLDYELIRTNPKLFCGHSDVNVLSNAILKKAGLVTYSGPHFTTFGNKLGFDYTFEYFKKCFFSSEDIQVLPAKTWSDDWWPNNQETQSFENNEGHWLINEGEATGTIVGGNLCTLNLIQGTEYMPDLKGSILFLEDDYEVHPGTVDRDLQSLIHLESFKGVKAIVLGRFQKQTNMTRSLLSKIIYTKKELANIPIIANVDFGHTTPLITYPIGGQASLNCYNGNINLTLSTQ